jgi:nitrogen regulatory protein PII
MKTIFIVFNQANTERVEYMLDRIGIRGFTWWENVQGRGSLTGEPRKGTHTWPEMNSAVITVVEDEKVEEILKNIRKIDSVNEEVGIRAFVWNVESMV